MWCFKGKQVSLKTTIFKIENKHAINLSAFDASSFLLTAQFFN
jgi:hypothetical protein